MRRSLAAALARPAAVAASRQPYSLAPLEAIIVRVHVYKPRKVAAIHHAFTNRFILIVIVTPAVACVITTILCVCHVPCCRGSACATNR